MTETEARQFIGRVKDLCVEYQRDCACNIELKEHYEYKHVPKLKFLIGEISLLIDK